MTVKELIVALSKLSDEDQRCMVEVRNSHDDWTECDMVEVEDESYSSWDRERECAIHKVVRLR